MVIKSTLNKSKNKKNLNKSQANRPKLTCNLKMPFLRTNFSRTLLKK